MICARKRAGNFAVPIIFTTFADVIPWMAGKGMPAAQVHGLAYLNKKDVY